MMSPPVGFPVQFWPNGTQEDSTPIAAIVTRSNNDGKGQVRLNVLYEGGGEMRSPGEYVRHISDPWISLNQDQMRKAKATTPRGAWEYVPGLYPAGMKQADRAFQEQRVMSTA